MHSCRVPFEAMLAQVGIPTRVHTVSYAGKTILLGIPRNFLCFPRGPRYGWLIWEEVRWPSSRLQGFNFKLESCTTGTGSTISSPMSGTIW
eukprot:3876755-Rhodomonas_salina.2